MAGDIKCPRCGKEVSDLQSIDAGLAAKLREGGNTEPLPPQVCAGCFSQVAGTIARGSVLLAREKAKEQKKLMLWKSRVNLIKKARNYMNEKAFSDAAVAYEKYMKVLEMVFECKPGELTPEHFKDSARTQELTVVASVMWDLLRIYDTSEKYGPRQVAMAQKLALFLRFTPIYPDILRKAEVFERSARNPAVIKSFLKAVDANRGRCFIATSAFEYHSAEVQTLTQFRDAVLMNNIFGKAFVEIYYAISPVFAAFLDKHPSLKPAVRKFLRVLVKQIS